MNTQDDVSKMNQRDFSYHLMRTAPENTDEYWAFHRAAHYYEQASLMVTMAGDYAQARRDRMKAARAYKRGWALRNQRLSNNKQAA